VLGVISVTLVYIVTTAAFIYLVPVSQTGSATEFAHHAGVSMLGSAGPPVLAVAVILSAVASAMALLMMAPLLYVGMSRDGLFPKAFAAADPATRVPVGATALLASLATLYSIIGTFQQIVAFFICTALGFTALAAAGLIVVRRRDPGAAGIFRAPGYPWTTGLFVSLVTIVIAIIAIGRPHEASAGVALVVLGVPVSRMFVGRPPGRLLHRGIDSLSSR
jgi:APA family basic amino acid/polyamine antiporter